MKRLFDIFLSLLAIFILAIPLCILYLLIKYKLGSPVLFSQVRPGKDGRLFTMYKFRTMTNERDQAGELLPDEQRLTKFGQLLRATSLDELPELFNVIRGDMSLVGPRPLLPEYLRLYNEHQLRRNEVRPGITGWAQINGRNNLSWEQKFDLDVWYVENRSFLLDIRVLCLTVVKVFKRENISQDGHVTIERFKGSPKDKRTNE